MTDQERIHELESIARSIEKEVLHLKVAIRCFCIAAVASAKKPTVTVIDDDTPPF